MPLGAGSDSLFWPVPSLTPCVQAHYSSVLEKTRRLFLVGTSLEILVHCREGISARNSPDGVSELAGSSGEMPEVSRWERCLAIIAVLAAVVVAIVISRCF